MKKTIRSGTREVIHNVFMRTLSEQRCGQLLTALEDVYKRTADLTDVVAELEKDFRTIPEFEKSMFEYICRQHWSMENNEYLACHWHEYINNLASKKRTPILFPSANDFHFYLCDTRYVPEQSLKNCKSFRYRLRIGPGVDEIGQIPIPNEMHLRKTVGANPKKPGAVGRESRLKLLEEKAKKHKILTVPHS